MLARRKALHALRTYLNIILRTAALLAVTLGLALGPAAPLRVVQAVTWQVGLIPDHEGIDGGGYNLLATQGLARAVTDLGITSTIYADATTGGDYYTDNLDLCANAGNQLCITVGFGAETATITAAVEYPLTRFAVVDVTYTDYPDNLRGITFDVKSAAYLAGTLAGLMSQSHVLYTLGGMNMTPVNDFILPFAYGAICINRNNSVAVEYAGDFSNPTLGGQMAEHMISEYGMDVIFAAAGETGGGAILSAAQSGAWAIGTDTDAYVTDFNNGSVSGADKALTSVLKKIDNAVYDTIHDLTLDAFTPGTLSYGLASGNVGLAPYHAADSAIPAAVKARVDRMQADLVAGRINIDGQSCPQYVYLPAVKK